MINDNTILSSFNDRPTLLEWLKKVEEALKTDTATGVSVENPSVNSYIFKITFADGKTIASDPVKLPDSVKGVSISNNHLIITTQGGIREDLGVINPYADTIVLNSETNTTEIGNNVKIDGNVQLGQQLNVNGVSIFNGNVNFSGGEINIDDNVYLSDSYSLDFSQGGMITDYAGNSGVVSPNKVLGTNDEGHIVYKEVSGGTQWYHHKLNKSDNTSIEFVFPFEKSLLELVNGYISYRNVFGALLAINGPTIGNLNPKYTFSVFYFDYDKSIVCYSVKGDGTIAETKIKVTDYSNDVVTKYLIG